MSPSIVLAGVEAGLLRDLVEQYRELVTTPQSGDPAIARLVPDAYADDAEAAAEFRALTASDLLAGRAADADVVLAALPAPGADETPEQTVAIADAHVSAWLRVLTGLRLVFAERIGIVDESPLDADDPRAGVYEWLGYRLELLLQDLDA